MTQKNILISFLLITALCGVIAPLNLRADILNDARNTLKQWVEVEKTITKESKDWRIEKSALADVMSSLKKEEKILREVINNAKKDTTMADQKRLKIISKRNDYKESSKALKDNMIQYEKQARQLIKSLPKPLKEELGPQIIKLNSQEIDYSISERTQTLITILTSVQKFDNSITVISSRHTTPSGTEVEIKTLYLGLSRAFYVDGALTTAGILSPSAARDEWQSSERLDLAAEILLAINTYENRKSPALITLPLQLAQ